MSDPKQQPPFQYMLRNNPEELRGKIDFEDSDLLTESEKLAGIDIIAEYRKKLADLEYFMKYEYMLFNAKVNKCLLNRCYQDIHRSRHEIRDCVNGCTQGIKSADKFVSDKVELFTTSFAQCLEEAQKPKKNVMQDTFECYDTMLNTFDSLKKEVKDEFSFYQ